MKTKTVNKSKLNSMLDKAIKDVERLGIEIQHTINPNVRTYKATSYFGQVRFRGDIKEWEITISEYHLNNGYNAVIETLVHEVLHTCKGARGHGKQWREYANMVNEVYGYSISRLGTQENGYTLPKRKRKVNYIIKCVNCDNVITRTRKSKLVTHTHHYHCGGCHSKLIRTL